MSDAETKNATVSLDDRLFQIETKLSIHLYAVSAHGYTVVCDTWIEDRVDPWEMEYGIYARKCVAEWKRDEIIRSLESQGYQRNGLHGLFSKGYEGTQLCIDHLKVDPTEISLDSSGEYSYGGKRVIL